VMKKVLAVRPDLRLIISSATIEAALFRDYYGKLSVVEVPGRLFPVDMVYRPSISGDEDDYSAALLQVVRLPIDDKTISFLRIMQG